MGSGPAVSGRAWASNTATVLKAGPGRAGPGHTFFNIRPVQGPIMDAHVNSVSYTSASLRSTTVPRRQLLFQIKLGTPKRTTHTQTYIHTDRQTYIQTDRHTYRQTDIQTHTNYNHIHTCIHTAHTHARTHTHEYA